MLVDDVVDRKVSFFIAVRTESLPAYENTGNAEPLQCSAMLWCGVLLARWSIATQKQRLIVQEKGSPRKAELGLTGNGPLRS
jgi:hypothetical protein